MGSLRFELGMRTQAESWVGSGPCKMWSLRLWRLSQRRGSLQQRMTGLLGEGRDGAEAGEAAVMDGSETSCDFHSWFLGQTKLLLMQPLMQGLLVLCSAHMLKPSGFKASVGSSLTPGSEHTREGPGWPANPR